MITYISDEWEIKREITRENTTNNKFFNYGSKLKTNLVAVNGNQKRKIWAICFSNAASLYIIKNKEKLYIPDYRL